MPGYLVLARKYRSRTFDEVIGQEHVAQTLRNAIRTNRVAHAYLFTGTRGVGKTTMARILAKALNCLAADEPTETPCNECEACRAIARGDDVDVVEIDGASNRGIDEIRELRANAIFRPARCRYKIYYIDEVHQITRDAFNALLKTLEEPPEHVKFIFATTEAEKVPATILSRCQRFDFRNIATRRIADHLADICRSEGVEADDDALFRIARAAAGSMRDGLSLLDQVLAGADAVSAEDVIRILGTPPDERIVRIVSGVAEGDAAAALTELGGVLEGGVTLSSAVEAVGDALRNMLIASTCGCDSELIELPDAQRNAIADLAKRFSTPALVHAVGLWQSVTRNVRGSSVARALVEAGLVRLAAADQFVDPASLIERLETLASGAPASAAGRRQKKKLSADRPSAPASRTAEPARPAVAANTPAPAPPRSIRWEPDWLRRNWTDVVAALDGPGQTRLAGALRPAAVADFADDVLTLQYDEAHENVRLQADGPLRDAIVAALTALAGRAIECHFVAGGSGSGVAPPTVHRALSTSEKTELSKDPAVRKVMELFDGDIADMTRVAAPPTAVNGDEAAGSEDDE